MIKLIAGVLVLLAAAVIAVGQPREFKDPMTGGRDGGWLVAWNLPVVGPTTCAVWTWSDGAVRTTGLPINCSRT